MREKYCEYCGRPYPPRKKEQKFCSVPCSNADKERGRCSRCGKAIKSSDLRPTEDGFICIDHKDATVLYERWLEIHRFRCHGTIYTNF
jgi:hypothetical protein